MTQPTSGRNAPTQRRSPGAPAPTRAGRDDSAGTQVGPGTARIAVDLLGGDRAPAVVVDGALRACAADPDLHLLLVGPPAVADGVISALPEPDRARVRVLPAARAATDDLPGRAVTSVSAATAAVAAGHADALLSAGPTGASVAAAALRLGRWAGVRRPALAAVLPALAGPVLLLDVGASVDTGAGVLCRHAQLGAAYALIRHGLAAPRVGLLSIGTEPGKGDRPRRAAAPLLTALTLPGEAHYAGLVEGHDVAVGTRVDVVVTDGFTGNVLLKGIEGAYAMAGARRPAGTVARAAVLLGVGGTVVVCHGGASGDDIASGIALAASHVRHATVTEMAALMESVPVDGQPGRLSRAAGERSAERREVVA